MSKKELKEKLERLRVSRGAHRGVLTKRIGEANDILEPEGMLSNEQIKQLDILHRLLESKLKPLTKAFYHYVKLKLFKTRSRIQRGSWKGWLSGTHDKANHPSFGAFRRFISSTTSRQVQVIDCRSSQNHLLDWLDDRIVLDQKPKDLETVRSAPSWRDSQSNSQRSMATLSQSFKSSWSSLVWFNS